MIYPAELCSRETQVFMKYKNVLLLSVALLTFSSPLLYSQSEEVKIVVIENTNQKTHPNRVPAKSQVRCCYYSFTNSLELSFLSNLGTVTVSLENLNTGEMKEYVGTSSTGVMMIPVVPNSAYRMNIVTESGRDYIAQFFAGENDSDS